MACTCGCAYYPGSAAILNFVGLTYEANLQQRKMGADAKARGFQPLLRLWGAESLVALKSSVKASSTRGQHASTNQLLMTYHAWNA